MESRWGILVFLFEPDPNRGNALRIGTRNLVHDTTALHVVSLEKHFRYGPKRLVGRDLERWAETGREYEFSILYLREENREA
jgi:hypothetical protein